MQHLDEKIFEENKTVICQQMIECPSSFIDIGIYYTLYHKSLCNKIHFENILKTPFMAKLVEEDWHILQQTASVKVNKQKMSDDLINVYKSLTEETVRLPDGLQIRPTENRSMWIKGSYLITLNSESDGVCDVTACYKSDDKEASDILTKMIIRFEKEEEDESSFYLLMKNSYGDLDLKKYNAKVPPGIDINLNYGTGFDKANATIQEKLTTKSHGLYILHGSPGTGKSTYIKWLATTIKKKFIYIPEFMVPMINDPSVMQLFLEHTNSVIILEDAEKLITKREDESPQNMASLILNITDGILADIMKLSVIITYNTSSENIDQALLRKGRLQYIHEFKPLSKDDVIVLMAHHGLTEKQIDELLDKKLIKDKMSLADIYNVYDATGFQTKAKQPTIGFGA